MYYSGCNFKLSDSLDVLRAKFMNIWLLKVMTNMMLRGVLSKYHGIASIGLHVRACLWGVWRNLVYQWGFSSQIKCTRFAKLDVECFAQKHRIWSNLGAFYPNWSKLGTFCFALYHYLSSQIQMTNFATLGVLSTQFGLNWAHFIQFDLNYVFFFSFL